MSVYNSTTKALPLLVNPQKTLFFLGVLCVCQTHLLAQSVPVDSKPVKPITAFVEAGVFGVAGNQMPFWLRANQYGIVPRAGSTATLRVGLTADYSPINAADSTRKQKKLDWGYGLELTGNLGQASQVLLPEAYVKARWGRFELYAGRRRSIAGLVDTLLTSGAYAWSGNALPMPKIQLGTIGYVPIGLTKGFVSINAFINHGWFNDGFVQHSYLHQKALYIRLGKPQAKVKFYFGGNHLVQWGGYAPGLIGAKGLSDKMDGQLASNLDALFRVITAGRGTGYLPSQGVISIDEGNRIGNHLGSFDGGVELTLGNYQVFAYRQNLYETGALFYLTNITDGLNGIRIQRRAKTTHRFSVDHLVVEFFNSKSQGGSEFVIDDPYRRGNNNYFNHSQYQDGWIYLGRTIGTPFITPQAEVNPGLPVGQPIANNRVSLWHLGLAGRIGPQLQWFSKLSYSRNFGTYNTPYPAGTNQFSALLSVATPLELPTLGRVQLHASLALDTGKLLENASGCYIGLRKVMTNQANKSVKDN
jgi:hypothetical protein